MAVQHNTSSCYVYLSPTANAYALGTSQPHIQNYTGIFLDTSFTANNLQLSLVLEVAAQLLYFCICLASILPNQSFLLQEQCQWYPFIL